MLDEIDVLSWLEETEPVSSVQPVKKTAHSDTLISSGSSGTCFEINREVLLSLLDKVMPVVPSRDIVPVLTNLQFNVSDQHLQIVASSTEMSISVTTSQVDCKVAGVEVFPAKTFVAVVKEAIAGSTVYVEVTAHGLVIVAGTYTAEIALGSGKGFPEIEDVKDLSFHQIDRKSFLEAINSVKYALPNRESSVQETLRMISIKGGKFTACDGSRFQQVRIDGFRLNMQLPTFSISTLLKVLSNTDQEFLEVAEVGKKLVFVFSNCVFYLNKLDDPYPNVEQLWLRPALSNDQELIVNKAELITAVKQVKVTADSESNAIGLIIDESSITITAKDVNNSGKTVIACKWAGKPKTIVVNFLHLAEMLKSYPGDTCRFLLGEDTKSYKAPVLLKDDESMSIATMAQMLSYRAGL